MKILLISAINPYIETEARYPQLGLGYLVSYMRKKLGRNTHEYKIITSKVEEFLNTFQPDIVGISGCSQNYRIVEKYASICKKKGLLVIVGGIHISLLPESLSKDMDVGVLFEGEETMTELIQILDKWGRFEKDMLSSVKSICYHHNGQVVCTENRPLIDDLDEIPFPARELLDIKGTHLSMFSSRGCPYRCIFCASSRFWKTTRLTSAQYLAEEICELYYNYGAKLISFYDDLFIVNKHRISKLIDILASKGILGKVRFSCSARANLIDDVTAKLMKEMGIVSVALGLESGHPRVLKSLKGENVSPQINAEAVKILDRYNIAPNASFIIGSPTETKEEIMTTYDFIRKLPLRNFNVYVMTPFPGTPVWSEAIAKGLINENFDNWPILDAVHFAKHYRNAIIVSNELSREQLYRVYNKFQRLRYWVFLKNAYHHPFIKDVPKMALSLAKEKFSDFVRK
ncbi:MAG: B12-binding domain-containing radical SAM protein [Sedimentisphaerales bacterium]|nr:B12-binding domain-containing radical SAM protein [Sedimentisphaerales bacterium]